MTLKITGTTMTSDQSAHTARQAPSGHGREVSQPWMPGQMLDGNTAVTAMVLADIVGRGDLPEGHRLWPHIHGWAAELGLTGPDAIARASQPPPGTNRQQQEPARRQPDRAAAR
jgi:hypothetical protein